ncbi:hypothetical protein M9H77_23153 [Catharanthus roseus]|uniref:Uncharacterized protein n=1 Tax=Catharanthus roseus TaxID=4058 RepID=A0ACC0AU82_CATRO|nr:hypothetical protein M9H77_23153 [Catharanthus roseus]
MVVFIEEALKYKLKGFEDQGKASKEQIGGKNGEILGKSTLPPTVSLPLLLLIGLFRHNHLEEYTIPHPTGLTLLSPVGFGLRSANTTLLRDFIIELRFFIKRGDLGMVRNLIYNLKRIHIIKVLEQPQNEGLIMSIDGHLPTQSHQEGTSDPTRMNLNETLRSMQQSIEGIVRQFQSVAKDVEELKKGKSSAILEKRVGDYLGGFNLPHH